MGVRNMRKIKMVIDTVTVSGEPNVNGVTYSRDEFNKMLENMVFNDTEVVLCVHTTLTHTLDIKPENILGKVIYIMDGKIIVEIDEEKKENIDNLILEGYKAGMIYLANIKVEEDLSLKEVCGMQILCYEMIKVSTDEKGENDEETNQE